MMMTQQLQVRIEDAHTSGAYPKRPLTLVQGQGCTVWDEMGNAYLDATSGQGVALLGHSHPVIVETIRQQAETLITCPEIFYNDQRAQLYDVLSSVLPAELNRFFLCNSGAEAIEGALKVARLLTRRQGIIATKRGFHGRTLGALSLTWNKKYREPFVDWQPDVVHVAYNNLDAMREVISSDVAAVVIEAVQGEGGVHVADAEYLRGVRALCDEHSVMLVVDEIQTGFGRTGRWFAFEEADIVPDIVAMGKGLAGGVPMGAVCWRDVHGQIPRGSHGSTFGGNPLACASAVATINTLRDENLPEQSRDKGEWLVRELQEANSSQVREIRGWGLMIGIELRGRVTPILQQLQERGVLALPAGVNVLRLLPPLIINQDELKQLRDAVIEVLDD